MTIFNLGSINIDHFYNLPHLPRTGETIASQSYQKMLGAKGANQSVAIVKSGGAVKHIGAINSSEQHYVNYLKNLGVDTKFIKHLNSPTGHAVIMVNEKNAENQIVIHSGANNHISTLMIDEALDQATTNDWALCQNETSNTTYFCKKAHSLGMNVCYCAAPFVAENIIPLLPYLTMLVLNEVEAQDLEHALGKTLDSINLPHLIITLGDKGVIYCGLEGNHQLKALPVKALDTTGAGDTFLGMFLSRYDAGDSLVDALIYANIGAGVQVTREGSAIAIPDDHEIQTHLTSSKLSLT